MERMMVSRKMKHSFMKKGDRIRHSWKAIVILLIGLTLEIRLIGKIDVIIFISWKETSCSPCFRWATKLTNASCLPSWKSRISNQSNEVMLKNARMLFFHSAMSGSNWGLSDVARKSFGIDCGAPRSLDS